MKSIASTDKMFKYSTDKPNVDNHLIHATHNLTCTTSASPCKEGVLLPMWRPQGNLSDGNMVFRSLAYMFGLLYMFLGVSIISDKFVSGIDEITSKTRKVPVTLKDGSTVVVKMRVWNETVANLTLMALGSSAPEILLSIIEICGNRFQAGELGPSTIVGSAAYNLFIITAICVYVVPVSESRTIKQLHVFFVTAIWSVFAYIWLYIILLINSEGVVEVWEATLTFVFFPLTVLTAYLTDREILIRCCLSKVDKDSDIELLIDEENIDRDRENAKIFNKEYTAPVLKKRIEKTASAIKEIRQSNPELDLKNLVALARVYDICQDHNSKAYYRSPEVRRKSFCIKPDRKKLKKQFTKMSNSVGGDPVTKVFFEHPRYSVMENASKVILIVKRVNGDMSLACLVDYHTVDGSMNAGKGYISKSGTLTFAPNKKREKISITVVDDDVFLGNRNFYVHLTKPRLEVDTDNFIDSENQIKLCYPSVATVTVIDDDHNGIFNFLKSGMTVQEDVGNVSVLVCRDMGAKGRVKVPYKIVEGAADRGKVFQVASQELIFEQDQTEKSIEVQILKEDLYCKRKHLKLVLDSPQLIDTNKDAAVSSRTSRTSNVDESAKPTMGKCNSFMLVITEAHKFKKLVDEVAVITPPEVAALTWREQFEYAITVTSSKDYPEEVSLPTITDYITHYICLTWKILAAFVPPTNHLGGWACFMISILTIGILTAVVGDMASALGCTVGFKDALTAITFVAIGTSLPDTFASKLAAINERYADSAIGNVTGSNAVNVFLGLGIAWTIAAVYLDLKGEKFVVPPGDLSSSVIVYCILSLVAIVLLVARRHKSVGGELGGPYYLRIVTSLILVVCWILYLIISSLVIYCRF